MFEHQRNWVLSAWEPGRVIRSRCRDELKAMRIRPILWPLVAAVAVAALALVLRQGGTPNAHSSAVVTGHSARVMIHDYAFIPQTLTVHPGTVITFTNLDQTAHTATSTATSPAFDTGTLDPGHSATVRLTRPGVYHYSCQFHAFMTGTIKVVG